MRLSATLPSGEHITAYELVIPDGHFAWHEVTKQMTRIPSTIAIEKRVYEAAKMMEQIRFRLGSYPLYVNSWIRDSYTNKMVGGSPKSRHLYGDAVDFYCNHISPIQIYKILDSYWEKGGLAVYKNHVHIDCRGYEARW